MPVTAVAMSRVIRRFASSAGVILWHLWLTSIVRPMNETAIAAPAIYLSLGVVGFVAGMFARRLPADSQVALILPIVVGGLYLFFAIGRSAGDPLLIFVLMIFSLLAPFALAYAFHVRRKAEEKSFAWAGLIISLAVFAMFVLFMVGSAMNLGAAMGLLK